MFTEPWISSSLFQMGKLGSNPLAGLAALGLGGLATPANTGGLNPAGKSTLSAIYSMFRQTRYFNSVEYATVQLHFVI